MYVCGGGVHTIALLWATDLGMELQGVIRYFMCVLGTDLSSSRDWEISLAPLSSPPQNLFKHQIVLFYVFMK